MLNIFDVKATFNYLFHLLFVPICKFNLTDMLVFFSNLNEYLSIGFIDFLNILKMIEKPKSGVATEFAHKKRSKVYVQMTIRFECEFEVVVRYLHVVFLVEVEDILFLEENNF